MYSTMLLLPLMVHVSAVQRADTIVRNASVPIHRGVSSVVETLSIGTVDGPADYAFTDVHDIALGTDGSILVLDNSVGVVPTVRLFDARGRLVRQLGRRGSGPGEYHDPRVAASMPDGRFLVLDAVQRRLLVFSSTGEYLDTWTIPFYRLPSDPSLRVDVNGIISIRTLLSTTSARPSVDGLVRLRPGGVVIDTLPAPDLPDLSAPGLTLTIGTGRATGRAIFQVPFRPRSIWQWSPLGYFVTGVSDRYSIDLRLPRRRPDDGGSPPIWRSGDPVMAIRVGARQVPISAAERADQIRYIQEQVRGIDGERSGALEPMPRQKPFYRSFEVADDGRIWVAVHTASEQHTPPERRTDDGMVRPRIGWREPPLRDVFEPDGTYVGRVRLPYGFSPVTFRGDEIWGYVRGEFDVPFVKRYRVRWN
jgi:hypothetical protein